MAAYSVYKLTSPNGKIYIGITSKKPEYRWNGGKGYWQNKHLYSAILKYGWMNFKREILASGLTKKAACALEIELVKMHKSNNPKYGYNNSVGGEAPAAGRKATKEEIEKRVSKIKGKPMSERGRKNISDAKSGKPNGRTGKTGKESGNSGVVYQIECESNKVVCIYFGYAEMSRLTGFARTPVREAANGERGQAYGYYWRYARRGDEDVAV